MFTVWNLVTYCFYPAHDYIFKEDWQVFDFSVLTSSPDLVKPKTIKLIFVASPLRTQQ